MLSESIQQAINKQITHEFSASHAYMAMAAYFESLSLTGFAHWFRVQSEEEREHALRFFDYVNDRGGRVTLGAIDEPQNEFASPLDAFEHALAHEQRVTAAIHAIYTLAAQENDYATMSMLKWFIDEQVEEEKSAQEIIQHLKLIGDDGAGLLMLDRQLAEREGEEEE
ncbi:ferritin [Roseiflexus castenholzii]|uniref:Ferritin n=1 Tax=Roseiflexus castenholzii (strain DSM 13941 / HLO8) TaxID=383372 RepID=A7NP42_ROSCS|nr:ferritin [Roseiflexus castenholzii]ABU59338.1 Ferroxidase [Roseiflexus castenholzii DSM 13941]